MRIPAYQLIKTLVHGLKPAYLITGDDIFLCDEAKRDIHDHIQKHGFLDVTKWSAAQEEEDERLASLLLSYPLFQTKQVIYLYFDGKLPTIKQQKIIETALEHPDDTKIIVITCKKFDTKTQHAAWVNALDKIGLIITIWPLSYEQLKVFITMHAKKHHIPIQTDAITLLAQYSEGNTALAAQTIEKAAILDETITRTLIETLISQENHYTLFDLGDAFIMQDTRRTLNIIETLRETGMDLTLVLWSITREIRLLIDCLTNLSHGQQLSASFKKHNVIAKKQAIIQRVIRRHSLEKCYQWLQHAFLIDQKIKHFLINDAWREIQIFCLRTA